MFDQTFLEATPSDKKPVTIALSLLLQICAIGLLVLISLLYTDVLPGAVTRSLLVAPAPPQVTVPILPVSRSHPKLVARIFDPRRLFAPVVIPKKIPSLVQATPAPEIGVAGSLGEANGSDATGLSVLIGSVPEPPAPPLMEQAKNQPAHKPVRLGGRVAEANLIRKILPVYPPLAKAAHIQGTVEFTALISKEGNVENLQLVHGHPLLVRAAQEAVLQWRYRPTTLNGEAVEVVTDIIVNFTLAQ